MMKNKKLKCYSIKDLDQDWLAIMVFAYSWNDAKDNAYWYWLKDWFDSWRDYVCHVGKWITIRVEREKEVPKNAKPWVVPNEYYEKHWRHEY